MSRASTAGPAPDLTIVPANEVSLAEVATLFGQRGMAANCWCQRFKLRPREAFRLFPTDERAERFSRQAHCGEQHADATSGLVAVLDGELVGWCAVEPRTEYGGLLRNNRVPWVDRTEDKADTSVWAVTCVFTRVGFRRRGISRELVRAAVPFARDRGARAVEGYPILTSSSLVEELHVGSRRTFAEAGFVEVSHPTRRRVVMRIDFPV